MDIILVLLRLLHIVAAVAWVGLGVTVTFYMAPAALAAGEGGMRFLKTLLTRTSFGSIFGTAAGLTMLAGILLYVHGNALRNFSQTGNIILGIGAAAGILATIHGGAVTGRATRALGEALAQHVPDDGGSISPEGLATLRERAMKMGSHSRISFYLMVVALIGMASARYL
jgi:uncharacterized membrane protein